MDTKTWPKYIDKNDPDKTLIKLCHDRVSYFFKDEQKTQAWMETNNPLLGGSSPLNMIKIGRYQKVMEFVTNSLQGNRP